MKRISSIDFTRGVVMIIMALDHVRDLIHIDAITQSPTNLETTTPLLFFTRWITYLCAPVFVFLAGTSVYLSFSARKNIQESKRFLLRRGIFLIVLEFTLVNFLLYFDLGFHTLLFEVIAAIGFGFIVLSFLLRFSPATIGIAGLSIMVLYQTLMLIPFQQDSVVKEILTPLFNLSVFPFSNGVFIIAYPPIPWLAIMMVGFASGKFFEWPDQERKKLFFKIGTLALLLFVSIRMINMYGDPLPWSSQKDSVYTLLSFMNVTKYPPSLLFDLVTLGVMFLVLAFADQVKGSWKEIVTVYGKVPLYYFLLHFFVIHSTLMIILFLQGFDWDQLSFATGTFGRPNHVPSGVSLALVYFIWVAVVVFLYKPCFWFGRYKSKNTHWWLKYI